MSNDFIGINIAGAKEVADRLDKIPTDGFGAGVEAANEYIVDMERAYPSRVQHGEGNPYKWSSDKQRRAFFATDGFGGGIPYSRKQTLARGWKTIGSGKDQIVVNEVPYAQYVKDFKQQIGHMYDGWDIIATDAMERMEQIVRKFDAGVSNWLKKMGMTK